MDESKLHIGVHSLYEFILKLMDLWWLPYTQISSTWDRRILGDKANLCILKVATCIVDFEDIDWSYSSWIQYQNKGNTLASPWFNLSQNEEGQQIWDEFKLINIFNFSQNEGQQQTCYVVILSLEVNNFKSNWRRHFKMLFWFLTIWNFSISFSWWWTK